MLLQLIHNYVTWHNHSNTFLNDCVHHILFYIFYFGFHIFSYIIIIINIVIIINKIVNDNKKNSIK